MDITSTLSKIPDRIAITHIGKNEEVTVSTIHMHDGFYADQYETMIFYKDKNNKPEFQRRHASHDEALLGHIDAITFAIKEISND